MFEGDKWSKFDEAGVPTHDAKGVEVKHNQKALDKLTKGIKVQEEKYQKWLASTKK